MDKIVDLHEAYEKEKELKEQCVKSSKRFLDLLSIMAVWSVLGTLNRFALWAFPSVGIQVPVFYGLPFLILAGCAIYLYLKTDKMNKKLSKMIKDNDKAAAEGQAKNILQGLFGNPLTEEPNDGKIVH